MVAVAILAMAIFGIFHAYSVGFMGMADARDRTVATNYAREAMEDIKNMDFEKIITQSKSFINGTKFEREVIVQESTNLKKVTTKVYWKDRSGNTKIVETNMLVHFLQTTAGDATRIMLIADPYNILIEGTSTLTAVIKDNKGNTVTTWNGDIQFSITSGSGSLSPEVVTPEKGIANTTFTASSSEGNVIITAGATGLTSDSVTIKVTDPEIPVKIILSANPVFMTADTNNTSEITATIVDAGGETVTDATNEITFSISGPGILSSPTTITPANGVATINLTSNGTPGTITVTASTSELEPGVVDVITGGKISLSASPTTVPVNEKSEITVTTKDVNGVPINYIGYINLEISPNPDGSGIFENNLDTIEIYFDGSVSSIIVTFTATSEGTVNINAEDQAGILASADPITLNITPALIPDHIEVYADPSSIKAGGTDTSTITAQVKTADNITVTSYSEVITFSTNLGTFPGDLQEIDTNNGNVTYENGVATTITVSSGTLTSGTVEVGFYIEADHIELVANPQNIAVGGETCTITATIKDGETTVTGYSGTVKFSIVSSKSSAGTVRIKATSSFIDQYGYLKDIEGYLNIPVGITLELAEPPNITYDNETFHVSFDIDVQGAELILEEMQVSWLPENSDTLNKIEIKSPHTADSIVIFNNYASSAELINVEDITLSTGISNVKIYFSADMSGKTILDVTFNPNSGSYIVNLK